jgi:hypothetical protein
MSTGHHLFSPSSAHRWMVCAPSVAVALAYPDSSSWEAAEGTVAHDMASTCLQLNLDAGEVWQSVETATVDGHEIPITVEMREHVQAYIDYVRGLGGAMEIEQRMTFKSDPDFGGTADALVWDFDTATLHVIDFKYGKGVRVVAERNKQMMSYAMLALSRADNVIDPKEIVLHVHQPRVDNISQWGMDVAELVTFAKELSQAFGRVRNAIKWKESGQAFSPNHFQPGEHCKFCKHAPECIGLREQSIISAQEVFGDVTKVPTENIGQILAKADMIDAWIAAVRKEAMDRALKGEIIDGFKLVQKRAMRQWVDPAKVQERALDEMIDVYAPREVMSPAALEKVVNKKAFATLFGDLVQSVSSGLTLVAADDKRAAVDPATAAAEKAAGVFTAVE